MIVDAGHEIGNHSFSHEPWLHLYSRQQVRNEIIRAEEAIQAATGQLPRGFRGPGYSLSRDVLEVLADREYLYDASTFPTFLGPVARAYYFFKSDLSDDEKSKRRQLFGGIRDGFQPLRPYYWDLNHQTLLEIPVTTLPVLKIPIHFSYQLYLATYSPSLTRMYFRASLAICRLTGIQPSLLLHPLDFLGRADAPDLQFFPSMKVETPQKIELMKHLLSTMERNFSVVNMSQHSKLTSADVLARRKAPQGIPAKESGAESG